MILSTSIWAIALLATSVWAKEIAPNELLAAQKYDTGLVHEAIMAKKMSHWASEKKEGMMDSYKYPTLGYTKCKDGVVEAIKGDANNTFRCNNVCFRHTVRSDIMD